MAILEKKGTLESQWQSLINSRVALLVQIRKGSIENLLVWKSINENFQVSGAT